MINGILFNIQKFCIHDGPGIRTTIFLKGCPLRCRWCANPESQAFQIQALWDAAKCHSCQTCLSACFKSALSFQANRLFLNASLCDGCQICAERCPHEALKIEGQRKSVEEVVSVCLQDQVFYEESGGGVTISGGEGMSQPNFIRSLTDKLKKKNISCAIETTGAVNEMLFQDLAPRFDLLLFDIKHVDPLKHRLGCGQDNAQIFRNLAWASEHKLPILVRIPVIPGFNHELQDAQQIASSLSQLNIKKVQLLPFHQFGEKKYELLNLPYAYHHVPALHPEDLVAYQQIFLDQNMECIF